MIAYEYLFCVIFCDIKKAWELSSLVPRIEAFALPCIVERATSKPTPICKRTIPPYNTPNAGTRQYEPCAMAAKGDAHIYTHPENIYRCNVRDNT